MANYRTGDRRNEVTFVSPGGQLAIRLTTHNTDAICKAARDLKARFFVAMEGWDEMNDLPIWGVFDMRTAQENTPLPGSWSINDPVRLFPNNDAAVMYAVAMMGR